LILEMSVFIQTSVEGGVMKKVSIVLAAIMFCAMVPYGTSQAATVSVNVASESGVPVDGPSETDFVGVPSAPDASILLPSVDPSWPQAPLSSTVDGDPELTGAVWITTPTEADNATRTSYRLYQDSFIFNQACTATHLTGTLYTAANNVQVVYFNGELLGTGTDSDLNAGVPKLDTFLFTPVQDTANLPKENIFGFDVLTRGVPADQIATNPAGVIYNAVITYELPDVLWRPPIVNTRRAIVKNGTTLPIKFRLRDASGLIHTRQNIYLAITGPEGEVARFDFGRGSRSLRFARGNGQYIANFHTKRYSLQTGVRYTLSVNDICTGEPLGALTIQVFGKGGHQNGNKHQNGNGDQNGNGHQNGNKHQNGKGHKNGNGHQHGKK
jgi:hypothetical protein